MLISDVIRRSLACGLVTNDEAVWQGVTVDSVGRSHPVFRLAVGGEPRAFIKYFEPRRGETDGDPANERAVIALGSRPAVAVATAPSLVWDGDDRVIVTKALSGESAWANDHFGGGSLAPEQAWSALVDAAIPKLAALHLATRDLAQADADESAPLGSDEPWGLRLFSSDAPAELWADPVLGALLHDADVNATLRKGVQAARACWRRMCMVHGDLKHDNVLTDPATGGAVFVDWEMARVGDPAWDLAALMARLPMLSETSECWPQTARNGAVELVNRYVAETPLTAPALARRVVLYTASWLVIAAVQARSVDHSEQGAVDAESLMAKAAHTFAHAAELTEELIGEAHG